jgi:YebC/PmpR family DNA-binding regulatory protein
MAGHSKWSKVKHIKGVLDARRGRLFSKLSKEITVAAQIGGGNPDFNPRLRSAILAARAQSMPNDNIERAIKKGTGELEGGKMEELIYEGYGPGGVAIIVETATDNKNRTAAELRSIFAKNHGNLAASGSVSYMFHRKGRIELPAPASEEDRILEIILDAGAEELVQEEETFVILTPADKLYAVADALKAAGFSTTLQKLTFVPETTVTIANAEDAQRITRLCDALEDCDDVLEIHANFELAEFAENTGNS